MRESFRCQVVQLGWSQIAGEKESINHASNVAAQLIKGGWRMADGSQRIHRDQPRRGSVRSVKSIEAILCTTKHRLLFGSHVDWQNGESEG